MRNQREPSRNPDSGFRMSFRKECLIYFCSEKGKRGNKLVGYSVLPRIRVQVTRHSLSFSFFAQRPSPSNKKSGSFEIRRQEKVFLSYQLLYRENCKRDTLKLRTMDSRSVEGSKGSTLRRSRTAELKYGKSILSGKRILASSFLS
jgi:hypothetical protein